jgi:hypothetical protein
MVGIYNRFLAPPPGALTYGVEALRAVYPGMSDDEITDLLEETWSREYIYAPYVQHREGVLDGTYINIDKAGYRLIANQGPWPIDPAATNIFVFGGSTTFGYGLPDDQAIPSYLQDVLDRRGCQETIHVYNFGSSNYFSVQERILFEGLIEDGHVPDVAVFIDGLNEWSDAKYTERLSYLMTETRSELVFRAIKELPIVELARVFRDRLAPTVEDAGDPAEFREMAEGIVSRWRTNKRMIGATADSFEVEIVFVWQPVPYYEYNLEAHLFSEAVIERYNLGDELSKQQIGYGLLDEAVVAADGGGEFEDLLWLADIQAGRDEALYVDAVHYTAAFSEEIAGEIADFLIGEGYVCGSGDSE